MAKVTMTEIDEMLTRCIAQITQEEPEDGDGQNQTMALSDTFSELPICLAWLNMIS